MVQVFQSGNPQGKIAEMLGMTLGQGLGQGINSFYANKAIEDVMSDKSLANASTPQKLGRLQQALAPYGEMGQQMFQNRMAIEQMQAQEEQVKVAKKEAMEKEQRLFAHQKELQELKNKGKAPLGGISGQPVPPEQINKIEKVIQENPNATPEQLGILMGKAGINPAYSEPYIESRREAEKTKQKTEATEKETIRAEDIKFHEASKDYAEQITKEAKTAKRQLDTIEDVEKALKSGNVKPSSLASIFKGFGRIGEKLSNALLTGDEAIILSAVPEFLEGRKELFGVRLSDADLRLLQDKLPDINKSQEANQQIIDLMKKYANRAISREQAAKNVLETQGIKHRQGKLRPLGFEEKVEEEFDKMHRAESRKLTPEIALDYLNKANGNRQEAEELARKEGYEF